MTDRNHKGGDQGAVPRHPVDGPTIPALMALFLILGTAAFCLQETLGTAFAAILSGGLFACFLILFAVYCSGWLLKGHAAWREYQRHGRTYL